jgi:DNA (cytosine-5)-methyltransferase 3A
MKVLSLFDGISCGRVALERAGIPVELYFASEIDKNAIKISNKNYPNIVQLGSVTDFGYDCGQFCRKENGEYNTMGIDFIEDIDLLIGGSPCQDLSNYKYDRGDVKGLDGKKSNLFYHFVRLLKEVKPKYFLLENVASMQKKWVDVISQELGVEPIMINSSLVCGAERKRLYWTNIPGVIQPKDKNINLKDIILPAEQVPEKYWYTKYDVQYNGSDKKVEATILLNGHRQAKEVYNLNNKCNTLLCDGNGGNLVKKVYQNGKVRKLTPLEYERLQTLPDNYSDGVSDSARYTAIGNGWTVDVIAHILSFIPKD